MGDWGLSLGPMEFEMFLRARCRLEIVILGLSREMGFRAMRLGKSACE